MFYLLEKDRTHVLSNFYETIANNLSTKLVSLYACNHISRNSKISKNHTDMELNLISPCFWKILHK